MAKLQLRWNAQSGPATNTIEQNVKTNPIVSYILTQKKRGMQKKIITENLMRQGYPYRSIKNAYSLIHKFSRSKLDWRSPTAINETSRMIRNDVRKGKITYSTGMKVLLQARDNLRSNIINTRDRRLSQINQEVRITKRLLMKQYANPLMMQQYRIAGKT